MMIHPVLLSGGAGTRLWPLSRKSFPKQFSRLVGDESLFQASARRIAGEGFAAPLIVTGEAFRFIVTEQLDAIGVSPQAVLLEPEERNTAPAILAAALHLSARDSDSIMLIAPSDHVIAEADAFRGVVEAAVPSALDGHIVTFGIRPTRPETGYGYLELAEAADPRAGTPQPLASFVEKPDPDTAGRMLSGNHLWNAGIFLATARTILDASLEHAPDLIDAVQQALDCAMTDLGFTRLDAGPWQRLDSISFDYAVMERADNVTVMPYPSHWSDLGGWDAVWLEAQRDADGNACSSQATAIACQDSLLRSETEGLEIVGIGLRDTIAVAMGDAVLVAHKSQAQRVREAVDALKARQARQATEFPRDHRPWGWFESLARGGRFQVKRIVVHPGAALSLQSHHHRAEHWIVVQGTAKVTIDQEESLLSENESVYVPLGAVHRLENPGKVDVILIEVQTGSYLGEDDITRYEDAYARS